MCAYIGQALENDEQRTKERQDDNRARWEASLSRVRQRLGVLYEDRLDGRITVAVYDEKAAALTGEQATLEEKIGALKEQSSPNRSRRKPALTNPLSPPPDWSPARIYSLGQRSPALYAAGEKDEKRQLVSSVFAGLTLSGEGQLTARFKPSYAALHQAVHQTNQSNQGIGSRVHVSSLPISPTLELAESGSGKQKTPRRDVFCPVWREKWDEFRKQCWD